MSTFLQLPVEIRMMIYDHLFEFPPDENVMITVMKGEQYQALGPHRRSTFQPQEEYSGTILSSTTYTRTRHYCGNCAPTCFKPEGPPSLPGICPWRWGCAPWDWKTFARGDFCVDSLPQLHPAILSTCRQICSEATPYLYSQRTFDFFNDHLVGNFFFRDRGPDSSRALQAISFGAEVRATGGGTKVPSDSPAWELFCDALQKYGRIESLELVVTLPDGGLPSGRMQADGCRPLTESDIRLLVDLHYPWLDWATSLVKVRGINALKVICRGSLEEYDGASARFPSPRDVDLEYKVEHSLYCSGSIEEGFAGYLRTQMGIPEATTSDFQG